MFKTLTLIEKKPDCLKLDDLSTSGLSLGGIMRAHDQPLLLILLTLFVLLSVVGHFHSWNKNTSLVDLKIVSGFRIYKSCRMFHSHQ